MKSFILGLSFLLLISLGGFFYRNAVEYAQRPVNCPVERLICPDGTELMRSGLSCEFTTCPPPNVSLAEFGLTFALPEDFRERPSDTEDKVRYEGIESEQEIAPRVIEIRRYNITAPATPLQIIQETAIGETSGEPVSPGRFSSVTLGGRNFTVVPIDRFEAVVQVAYYLSRANDVLRFDAIDHGVAEWTNPDLDIEGLPAQKALRSLLSTLQVD